MYKTYHHLRWPIYIMCNTLLFLVGYNSDIKYLSRKLAALQQEKKQLTAQLQHKKSSPILTTTPITSSIKSPNATNILTILEKTALTTDISLQACELMSPQNSQDNIAHIIHLELSDTYQHLLLFINKLLQLPLWLTIDKLTFTQPSATNAHALSLRLELLIHKEHHPTSSQDFAFTLTSTKNIFAPPPQEKDLSSWHTQELRFMGILYSARSIVALITDPLGNSYTVKIGDKIGNNHSTIVAIDQQQITTSQHADNLYRNNNKL